MGFLGGFCSGMFLFFVFGWLVVGMGLWSVFFELFVIKVVYFDWREVSVEIFGVCVC